MRSVICVFILFHCFFLHAQNEVNVWQFGYGAGIDFNSTPPIATTEGQLSTWEGCASICDENGKLLIYTDGTTVYNGKHEIMVNGTDLHGSFSSAQSAMIIKQPLSDSIYIIFNPGEVLGTVKGFFYSIVNVRAQGGKGEVLSKNVKLKDNMTTESVSAVKHANGQDVWVLFKNDNSTEFVAYKVTSLGVSNVMSFSQPGPNIGTGYSSGYTLNSKFSVSGRKYAICIWDVGVCLYDFDNTTGNLKNLRIIPMVQPYGVEFSIDESKLYVTSFTQGLYQFETAGNASKIVSTQYLISVKSGMGAVQIAPDKKIYIVRNQSDSINIITDPNKSKSACGYKENAMYLNGKKCGIGLPPFISTYFSDSIKSRIVVTGKCKGDTYQFECVNLKATDSVAWNFGDPASGTGNTSSGFKTTHIFNSADSFKVQALVFRKNINNHYTLPETLKINIMVMGYAGRANQYPLTIDKCMRDSVELKPASGGNLGKVEWNNLSGNIMTRTIKTPGWYIATIYKSGENCYYIDSTLLKNLNDVKQPQLGADTSYCVKYGEQMNETLGTQLSGAYNYTWNTGANTKSVVITKPGTYIVKAEKTNECSLADTIEVLVKESAFYVPLKDTIFCNDGARKTISLTAKAYEKINWSTGERGESATISTAGIYRYEIKNACSDIKDSLKISFMDAPIVKLGRDTTICAANGYEIKSNTQGKFYLWSPGGEVSENLFTEYTGLISLEVKNEAGCSGKDEIMVTDSCLENCYVPNAFTPNGDGLNDVFRPVGTDIRGKGYFFRIYDRWGAMLFETNDVHAGWNGEIHQRLCASGVYFYTLEFVTSKQKTIHLRGTFHLEY